MYLNLCRRSYLLLLLIFTSACLSLGCSSSEVQNSANYYDILYKSTNQWSKNDLHLVTTRAEAGNPSAMYALSRWARHKKNYDLSYFWKKKAANFGVPAAMLSLGLDDLRGRGTEINPQNALYWLTLHSLSFADGESFSVDAINEAIALLTSEQQEKVMKKVYEDVETYRKRWQNFCKEYDQDPMC